MTDPQKKIVRECYAAVFYANDDIKVIAADGKLTPERTMDLLNRCNEAAAHARLLHASVIHGEPRTGE